MPINQKRRMCTNHCPIKLLQPWIAIEAIVDCRNGRSPHQKDYAEIVKLITKFSNPLAVVADYVESALPQIVQ